MSSRKRINELCPMKQKQQNEWPRSPLKRLHILLQLRELNLKWNKLRVQLSLKKQEREIMEKVLGVVHSRERVNSGWREKQGSLKLLDGLRTVEMRGLSRFLVVARLREKCRCLGKSYKKNPRSGILLLTSPRNCRELTR